MELQLKQAEPADKKQKKPAKEPVTGQAGVHRRSDMRSTKGAVEVPSVPAVRPAPSITWRKVWMKVVMLSLRKATWQRKRMRMMVKTALTRTLRRKEA